MFCSTGVTMQHEIFQKPVFVTLYRLREKIISSKAYALKAHSAHVELQLDDSNFSNSAEEAVAHENAIAKDKIAIRYSEHFDIFIARVVFQAIEYNSLIKSSANEKKKVPNLKSESPWYSDELVWYFELALQQFDEVLTLCKSEKFMDINNDLVRFDLVDMFLTSKCNADLAEVCKIQFAILYNCY